ncbi:ABC-type sugar transport system ATPase subunit [Nocardioides thalensis]|uniref:ABC-type sugar transport system ATPase subunit n=1 Tax=Nocardioides thalensis TaxID=1914755 RepID=A0A853C5P2_9ACTN|nr:sugar ABC transporter ATP-binding protein [Nocardioides thalensis]NYJ01992.1 ABC-type sugar transport system ATPase subunit [Nocardioides thalensis]
MTTDLRVVQRPGTRTGSSGLLEVRRLRKVYGGTAALADVDIHVGRGQLHALLGENGAGKSTLVKILAAVEHEDAGEVRLDGEALPPRRTPRTMAERGVVFIHQDLGLVATMTVAENIAQYAGYPTGLSGISWPATQARAREALARLDVALDPNVPVGELSIAEQAAVAIARALVQDARLIVLDEPTASLAAGEAARLLSTLERLREKGISCILVTHRLDEVLSHCDHVTVLRNGQVVGSRPVEELSRDDLIELIVGAVPEMPTRRSVPAGGPPRLAVRDLSGHGFGPVSFDVGPGEIVALTGFADAGHLALASALSGAGPIQGGDVQLDGRGYAARRPGQALSRGVQHVPAERNAEGLAGGLTVRENLFPNPRRRWWPLNHRRERSEADHWIHAFDVRPPNSNATVATLSGGNAQKVLVARTMATDPTLLVLCEPTAGVDIGARATIYRKLRDAAAQGLAVVLASSDFQEINDLADRAVVMRRGVVARVLDGDDLTIAALTGASYGN